MAIHNFSAMHEYVGTRRQPPPVCVEPRTTTQTSTAESSMGGYQ